MVRYAPVLLLLLATSASAQIQSRPTDPPLVTAVNESWYQLREPIQFAGDVYYPAGSAVFFDGNTMVRTGHYNGIPLYANTTVEPYSLVLVPISRGLMQPYERLRRGEIAGTTGSRAPSFPVSLSPSYPMVGYMPVAPTDLPVPAGAVGAYTPEPAMVNPPPSAPSLVTETAAPESPAPQRPMETLLKPENNDGLWISYLGGKWLSAGPAVRLRASEFTRVGEYEGFPVFVKQGDETRRTIYLPTRDELIAPYRLKE